MSGHRNRGDQNGLDFSDGLEINLVFMSRIEIELVLSSGSNLICFCGGVKIDFRFWCTGRIYLV